VKVQFFYIAAADPLSNAMQRSPLMRIIRLKEVIETSGLARSTIYKYIGEGTFPKTVSLGDRCVGWVESEVHDWILARIEERDLAEGAAVRPAGHISMAS
jgi:prophage regulatory protein